MNLRLRFLMNMGMALGVLIGVWLILAFMGDGGLATDLMNKERPPSWAYPFGTDSLGRDMLTRTLYGLTVSLKVGLLAATISAFIALVLGVASAVLGGVVDVFVSWLVDVCLALPHLVLLILISFAIGGGAKGVMIAVAITHWPGLTRIIRAEALQLKSAPYVLIAAKLGQSPWRIAVNHFVPHLLPQFIIGLLLLFPHAILHEAALSFLGFGLTPHVPAVGILLAESMRHISTGYWWLGVLPGLALLITVKMFDLLGDGVKKYFSPRTSQN